MICKRSICTVFLLVPVAAIRAQDPNADVPTVPQLIERLQALEKAAKSVSLQMRSTSVVPDGPTFETRGSLRVLTGTHFHVSMQVRFGEGMEGEHEVVRTPEGTWIREVDPIQGEVFLHMKPELMRELEAASKELGGDVAMGAIPSQSEAPLGSAMLRSIGERFALEVRAEPLVENGLDHWVVRGELREGEAAALEGLPEADMVEIVVRQRPLEVVRMVHFRRGQPILTLEIDDVQLDLPMSEASFRLEAGGRTFRDVMDHPETSAQIRAILEEAKAAREAKAAGGSGKGEAADKGDKGKDGGRR